MQFDLMIRGALYGGLMSLCIQIVPYGITISSALRNNTGEKGKQEAKRAALDFLTSVIALAISFFFSTVYFYGFILG